MARFTTFRFCLDPSAEQETVLRRHAGAARFGYNQCLRLVKQALDGKRRGTASKVPWSGFDLINAFNGWKRSGDAGRVLVAATDGTTTVQVTGLAWRGEVSQQVFEEAAVDLGRGLAAFTASRTGGRKGRQVGFPRFKSKKRTALSFRVRCKTSATGRASIRVGDQAPRTVTLPGVGTVAVRQDTRRLRRMLAKSRAKVVSATVAHRAGRWQVSLVCEAADLHHDRRHQPDPAADWVGVDRGLAVFVVAARADGTELLRVDDPPRPSRNAMGRQRRLARAVTRKQRGSRNRAKAAARLGRHHARVRAIRDRFLHQVSNKLVKTHARLAIETLNITGMLGNRHLAAAISDAAWGELARQLAYKQQWRSGHLTHVDRWYPSTKTCSSCRTVAPTVPLHQRTFTCAVCGYEADRDHNAAVNLAVWAEQHHAQARDLHAGGPVTNARRGEGSGRRTRAGETGPDDAGTVPTPPTVRRGRPRRALSHNSNEL
ncbi:putative transposase [Catellatospora sp. TT07R-123]|uniref:RNA-guided endonuclease InsQ/TnpB family protein n=1 Tax=Catellatospora sp. TT07R-123 TaxID=2733863 RepID=UPI001B18EF8F|nr:RNA-guided endonuclease TnpB family protein [Catellatospora sp. TT07R-123]GHJ42906.1 putative transposase [Catellatospora sp. TT07R-123]